MTYAQDAVAGEVPVTWLLILGAVALVTLAAAVIFTLLRRRPPKS